MYTEDTMLTNFSSTGRKPKVGSVGLMYYTARWYDPYLKRMGQPDSIIPEDVQGIQAWDRYAYVNNSPVRYTDSTGNALDQGGAPTCDPEELYQAYLKLADETSVLDYDGWLKEYYYTVAVYHLNQIEGVPELVDVSLNHVLSTKDPLMINGFGGAEKAVSTAFDLSGHELGVGLAIVLADIPTLGSAGRRGNTRSIGGELSDAWALFGELTEGYEIIKYGPDGKIIAYMGNDTYITFKISIQGQIMSPIIEYKEIEFKDKLQGIYEQVFTFAPLSFDMMFGELFTLSMTSRAIICPITPKLTSEVLNAVLTALTTIGDNGFYVSCLSWSSNTQDIGHWFFPTEDANVYNDNNYIFSVLDNAIFSPRGLWGLIGTTESYGIVGGSEIFVEKLFGYLPGSPETHLEEFIEDCRYERDFHGNDLVWFPGFIQNVYGKEKALELLEGIKL